MIKLYNTLARQLENFTPLKGKTVRMYSCGPTVYDYAHVGNLRSFIFADVLRRTIELNRYRVKMVMNITDVGHLVSDSDSGEEKLEVAARREGKSAWDIAKFYTDAFLGDLKRLNVREPFIMPRATDHIKEQIALIRKLQRKGFTYRTSDGVYFDTSKFPEYGKLSGQKLEEKEAGARVEVNTEKRQPWDFALWKLSAPVGGGHPERPEGVEGSREKKRDMEWSSPWGKGFPGWHIECSAMSRKYLGQPFDIHTGGIDHVPVHHTNEIAQSEAAYGKPLAKIWMHGEFLLVDEKRMGKSEGNLITVDELARRGINPLAYRYFVLGAHYRSKLNFTWEALGAAQNALTNLYATARLWPAPRGHAKEYEERFLAAVSNDLNTPEALAVMWDLVKSDETPRRKGAALLWFDRVLGLGLDQYVGKPVEIPLDVQEFLRLREVARHSKDFERADELRREIEARGFILEDTPQGAHLKEKH